MIINVFLFVMLYIIGTVFCFIACIFGSFYDTSDRAIMFSDIFYSFFASIIPILNIFVGIAALYYVANHADFEVWQGKK